MKDNPSYFLFLAAVLIAPLLFGAAHTYAYTVVFLMVLAGWLLLVPSYFEKNEKGVHIHWIKTGMGPLFIGMSVLIVFQMIPSYACVEDQDGRRVYLLEDERWLDEAQILNLRLARSFRRELPARSSVPTVSIFGYGLKTISKIIVHRDREGRFEKMNFIEEASGDSTVPAASAVLRRSEIHPVRQDHGSLYVDNDVKMRLKLELTRPREG